MLLSGAAANTGSAAVAPAALQYMAVAASLAGSGILAVNLDQHGPRAHPDCLLCLICG